MNDRGSIAMLVPALVTLVVVLLAFSVATGTVLGARAHAQAAADAAALAAAPVTFLPFGATGTPTEEARRFAEFHGGRLIHCDCTVNPTFEARTVTVEVSIEVAIPLIGVVQIPASARAQFAPAELLRR